MSIDPSKLFLRRGEDTERGRSKNQEKKVSKQIGGRVTIGSGNTDKDKGDAFAKDCRVRVEAKRTDHASIKIEKAWLEKIKHQCAVSEIPVVHIEIQDEDWYMVRPEEFEFILEGVRNSKRR